MDLKELLQLLVNTDSKDERMTIVEENMDKVSSTDGEGNEETLKAMEELQATLDETVAELETQKQKYIDRFFQGDKKEEDKKEDKEEEKEEVTLEKLGF